MRVIYLHQYFNTPDMTGGTRSFEIGRRLVAAGHRVEMITSWQEPSAAKQWFTTEAGGMRVHWMPVAYSNDMAYRSRVQAFATFARGAARRAAGLDGDVVFATSTPLTIACLRSTPRVASAFPWSSRYATSGRNCRSQWVLSEILFRDGPRAGLSILPIPMQLG